MSITLKNKLKKLPPKRVNKIKARTKELIAQEMTLRDLRKALQLTQEKMSLKLHMNQESISRLERRSDLLLSTLAAYIEAMGGKLTLTATFPNKPPVTINLEGALNSHPLK